MKHFKKITLLLVLLLMLTACSGKNDSKNQNADQTKESSQAQAKDGGVIRIGLSANLANLDPVKYTAMYESNVMNSIFDTLVNYNSDLTDFVPNLAKEWKISEDGTVYTFILRDDVYFQKGQFQDGRKMTAEDVKYSLMRSLNESALKRIRYIKDIQVKSDTELDVILEKPFSPFLAMLTDAGNGIVPREEVEGQGDKFGENPIGTGPFAFKEWQKDSYVELVRNENYWGEKPHLDGVKFSIITDENMMGNAIQSGDIDIATQLKGQNVALVEKNKDLTLDQIPGMSIGYFAFNVREGYPASDLRVRQAMNLALNREELTKGVFKFNESKEGYLPLPSKSWGYNEEAAKKVKEASGGSEEQIAKAKELLKEAGYENGFDLELITAANRVPVATIFQSQMKKIGVNVNIKSVEWGTFSDIVSQGNAASYIMGWTWYPDPDFFLFQMLASDQIGSLGNGGGYSNPELDKLLDQASRITDQAERAKVYGQAQDIIAEDLPHLDFYDQDVLTGLSNKVEGYVSRPDGRIVLVDGSSNTWLNQ